MADKHFGFLIINCWLGMILLHTCITQSRHMWWLSLYVSVPLVLHHSASGYVLKKLANNYFSKEATVIDQNDISSHGTVPLILQHASAQRYCQVDIAVVIFTCWYWEKFGHTYPSSIIILNRIHSCITVSINFISGILWLPSNHEH